MLQLLHIENIAIIEKADIEFQNGLNVMTGETGAGKSIVIGALGAVLGQRVSRELVRTGADGAVVSAVFFGELPEEWCHENGIEPEGELVITRKISADGKSACRVNGNIVTGAQLRELGSRLMDILGQNSGQKLLDERCHRSYLDGFCGLETELAAYKELYDAYRCSEKQASELEMDESEKERRLDSLRYQIDELEAAKIVPGEMEELSARRELLRNAGRLTDTVNEAYVSLYGGDNISGAISLIADAEGALSSASRFTDAFEKLSGRLSEIRYMTEDAADELRSFKDELNFSPWELDEIESRLDRLKRLSRKYGSTEDEMLSYLDSCKKELDAIQYSGERLAEMQMKTVKLRQKSEEKACELSERRRTAARVLEKQIMNELSQLSMKGVRFVIEFESGELTSTGFDTVRFLMSANAGETPARINKIASGGELARVMLAMKTVLAEKEVMETFIFDEIDTGVSGIAAQRVGEKLSGLALTKQVICVTHLPQIAAMADSHFVIEKNVLEGRTFTSIEKLEPDGREREIARLTGGENITEMTINAAREQLEAAKSYKKYLRKERGYNNDTL